MRAFDQPLDQRCVGMRVVMAWLIFVAWLGLAVLAGVLVGVVLGSAVSGSLVAGAIVALGLWHRHYRWMT
jgi:uncharacterized oligopeptide transporter (OPT) family protein